MHSQQNVKNVQECNKCIKIKNLCIKFVKKDCHYIRLHGQQNVTINSTISWDKMHYVGLYGIKLEYYNQFIEADFLAKIGHKLLGIYITKNINLYML